jgi:hypothetical protein
MRNKNHVPELSQAEMLNEEVAFNLVTLNATLEYLERKFPGAKQEIYQIAQRILQTHQESR